MAQTLRSPVGEAARGAATHPSWDLRALSAEYPLAGLLIDSASGAADWTQYRDDTLDISIFAFVAGACSSLLLAL